MSSSKDHFDKPPSEQTAAKIEILVEYFKAWASIIQSSDVRRGQRPQLLSYLDLFSGRGYFCGTIPSTPVRILDEVGKNPDWQQTVVMRFYEGDLQNHAALKSAIEQHPAFARMNTRPEVNRAEIDPEYIESLRVSKRTLSFVDPFGFKDISASSLAKITRKWGSDTVFFLSSAGIIRNLKHASQRDYLVEIMGEDAVEELSEMSDKEQNKQATSKEFTSCVLFHLEAALKVRFPGDFYFQSLRFEKKNSSLITHCLVFLSKHFRGFAKMKQVMAKRSLLDCCGFPRYLYRPSVGLGTPADGLALSERMEGCKDELFARYRGTSVLVEDLVDDGHKRRDPWIGNNYKRALLSLESEGDVTVTSEKKRNPKKMADSNLVTFHTKRTRGQ